MKYAKQFRRLLKRTRIRRSSELIQFKTQKKKSKGCVLLSYLITPLTSTKLGPFSNWAIARIWVKTLNQKGYDVDVIPWDDQSCQLKDTYDFAILHGGKNYHHIKAQLADLKHVYFSTGLYWKVHNDQAMQKTNYFNSKYSVTFKPDRYIYASEEAVVSESVGIMGLGSQMTKTSYKSFRNLTTLQNSFHAPQNINIAKKSTTNVLYLAGSGPIHKGLDYVLEASLAFPKADFHVVGKVDKTFKKLFRNRIGSNVYFHGYLQENSSKMIELLNTCGLLLHPSCAEGSPGAVFSALSYGLIPIVSVWSNVSLSEDLLWSEVELDQDAINATLEQYMSDSISPVEFEDQAKIVYHKYNQEVFEDNLAKSLDIALSWL